MSTPTPHPEPHEPARPVFGTLGGQPIEACLPFHLVDTDDAGTARTLAVTELTLPPELLAMVLFLTSRPGDLDADDHATRWGLICDALLTAGALAITQDYQRMRTVADERPDLDALLWWEDCLTQVRHLFTTEDTDTGAPTGTGTA